MPEPDHSPVRRRDVRATPQPITRRDDSTKMADTTSLVTGGVDTHKDFHVCVAVDELGRVLGTEQFPTTLRGYRSLLRWLGGFGQLGAVGVEGTGS